jgi:hypothetical protein
MFSDEQLAALTTEQRAELAGRLAALANRDRGGGGPPRTRRAAPGRPPVTARPVHRRWLATAAAGGGLALVAWIFTLASTLPDRYLAENWDAAWVGYDLALLVGLGLTAWAAWRDSRLLAPAALATAVLLVCDAWFDVMTASTTADLVGGAVTALLAELPLAAALLAVARPMLAGQPRRARG